MVIAVVRRSRSGYRAGRLALLVWLGIWCGPARGDDPTPAVQPAKPASRLWPSAIILEPPADRDALLARLRRPDLILWDATSFDQRWLGPDRSVGPVRIGTSVVGSVAVAVRPAVTRAALTVRLKILIEGDEPVLVPIALDGLLLGRVTEAGVDRPVAILGERRGWGVELNGRGEHALEVETSVLVRSTGSGQTLELAIPPAASTEVDLAVSRPLVAARAGTDEPLVIDPEPDRARARGHLSPRGRLEITWQEADPPGETLPTVLAARGEVAIVVNPDSLEARETWSVAAIRGQAREVRFRLKNAEEVLTVESDRRTVAATRRKVDHTQDDLIVPLSEPITPARPATIVLVTRRGRAGSAGAPPDGPTRFSLEGHPIQGARSQTGVIGVARSAAAEITSRIGSAIRQVDPRTDLPDAFRGQPDGWLGFEFAGQPFALELDVAPVVPRFEVTTRSTLSPSAEGVEVSTTLTGRVWQGRLFDLQVAVPAGLEFRPTAPTADGPTVQYKAKPGPLVVTFARPIGPGDTFSVPLRGAMTRPGDGLAPVPMFTPLGATVAATDVALVSGPNRVLDLGSGSSLHSTRSDTINPPLDWNWPGGFDPNHGAAVVWLRSDRAEETVPVKLSTHPRTVRHRSSLNVATDRQGADVVDEIAGDVAHGALTTLDVALPPEVPDRWVAEAGETLEREPLDPDPATGWRRYRIKLGEPTDSFQVRCRYRLDFSQAAAGTTNAEGGYPFHLQPIRICDGVSTGQSIRLLAESDVGLRVIAPGWLERPVETRSPTDSVQQVRQSFEHPGSTDPGPIEATATPGKLANLPTLVASRLWLRSIELPGGSLASSVQYRLESHPRTFAVRLPAGSRWVRGSVGLVELGPADVEQVEPDLYRITLPAAAGLGPIPIRVDSTLDAGLTADIWPAPELVNGVVQQSVWELSLLGTRAGVGVPAGWNDENHWYWSGLLWKREPRRSETDLARWLADGLPRQDGPEATAGRLGSRPDHGPVLGPEDLASGRHSYLFSRPGPPTVLRFTSFARATLVLLCSGPILLVGLLILTRRPPPRWLLASLLMLTLGVVALVEINTAFLIVESSALGLALAVVAALIQTVLDRRNRLPDALPTGTMVVMSGSPSGLSVSPLTPVESNDPTVIRPPLDQIGGSTSTYPTPDLHSPPLSFPAEETNE